MEVALFSLKKIITSLFLPPGIFIVVLLFGGLFCFFKERRAGLSALMIIPAIFLYLLSINPIKDALIAPLEEKYRIPSRIVGDSIVLLGGGVNHTAPDLTGRGAPSLAMTGRMVTAFRLYRRTNLPIIVAGGKVWKCGGTESPIVSRILVDMGVKPEKIFMDKTSKDTRENAIQVKEICDRIGSKRPLLVTSAYHMRRADFSFKKVGLQVIPFPSDFQMRRGGCREWIEFLPKMGSFDGSYKALKEYLGLIFYFLN